jgi:hypothetical protein
VKRSKASRGASFVELLLAGVLLFLLLGATLLLRRFVAPEYRPLVWVAGLLMAGVWLWAVIAQLRHEGRMASLWAEAGRRSLEFRRECARFALALPEGMEWSAQRGLLDGGTGLAPEAREHLALAAERFKKVLLDHALAGVGPASGELLMRRSADHWRLLWRVEGAEELLHADGPLHG